VAETPLLMWAVLVALALEAGVAEMVAVAGVPEGLEASAAVEVAEATMVALLAVPVDTAVAVEMQTAQKGPAAQALL